MAAAALGDSAAAVMEGLAWFDAALGDADPDDADMSVERVRALADRSALAGWIGAPTPVIELAERALTRARELDDPALVVRALTACCCDAVWNRRGGWSAISPRPPALPANWATYGD